MLAFLIPVALAYSKCGEIDSCVAQVNGSLPLIRNISTLPDGGASYSFTTSDCTEGLLALSEPCECGKESMDHNAPIYPGYCYAGVGDSSNVHSSYNMNFPFCKNQYGLTKNTFWAPNQIEHARCMCFDPETGISDMARVGKPMCTKGISYYEDCSIDGDDANEDLLAPYTGDKAKAIKLMFSHPQQPERSPACQCGQYGNCRAPTTLQPYNAPYCQYLAGVCSTVKECGILPWKSEGVFDDDGCACGDKTCYHNEDCTSNEKGDNYEYACTWNTQSSNPGSIIKMTLAMAELGYSFSIVVFVCSFFACIIAFLTYCRAKKL